MSEPTSEVQRDLMRAQAIQALLSIRGNASNETCAEIDEAAQRLAKSIVPAPKPA